MNGLGHLIQRASSSARLTLNGAPVTAPVTVRSWSSDGDTLSTKLRFGPYAARTEADAVLLDIDGVPEVVPLGDLLTIPAGVSFLYGLSVTVKSG